MTKGKASQDERALLGEYARALAAVGEAGPSKRSEALHDLDLNTMGFLDLSRDANAAMDRALDNHDDSAIVAFAEAFEATRERLRAEHGGKPADQLATEPSPPPVPPPTRPKANAELPMPALPVFVPEARPRPAPPPIERPKMQEQQQQQQQQFGRGTVRMVHATPLMPQPPSARLAAPLPPPLAPRSPPSARVSPQPPPVLPPAPPSGRAQPPSSGARVQQAPSVRPPAPGPFTPPSTPSLNAVRGGDTIARPPLAPMDPDGLPASVHFQQPRLALMQYAALRAEILSSPETMRGAVYARYQLTEPDDAAESAAWNARFSADRALFAQYMQVFSYFRGLQKR